MIESQNVLAQTTQTVPKQIRPRLDYVEVTQQPVVIRGFGLAVGEEYGIEYSLGSTDNKWIAYSPNGAQKKITTLFNPIAVATPGRYRIIPLTAVSSCARFDSIAGSGTHEWLLEYQEPTVIVNTTTTAGGGGDVNFASRLETLDGVVDDLAVHPDGLAQALQHRGFVYAEPGGHLQDFRLNLTPPLTAYDNTSIIVAQMDLDSDDSPQNPLVNVDALGFVPVLGKIGTPLFPRELPAFYTALLMWREDHFELLNPGDFQDGFTWSFFLDPGVTIISQNGILYKVSNMDRGDPAADSRAININARLTMLAPNSNDPVRVILPFHAHAQSSFAVASVYTGYSLGGVVTANVLPTSNILDFYIIPSTSGQITRQLLFSDIAGLPSILTLGFSLSYVARLP